MRDWHELRAEPNPEPEPPGEPAGPHVWATLDLGNGSRIRIKGDLESFEIENEYIRVDSFGQAPVPLFQGRRKFTIRGWA